LIAGIVLGILIGITTGTVFLVLLRTFAELSRQGISKVITLTGELLALPTFWVGGPWLTSGLLKLVPLDVLINPYLISLVCTFSLFVIYPAFRWIIKLGTSLGEGR
jgi:hypothetical protein